MFDDAGLKPRKSSFRPKGEEIDGSISLDGRTILFEAKWTRDPHPASSIYQFKGKVDGKLVGTVGLFISVAGFSTDAVDALVAGKDINVVLADGDDLRSIVAGEISAKSMLEEKLRAASETGAVFSPSNAGPRSRHLVFVEGRFDARILGIARDIFDKSHDVTIIPTGGPANMAPLIESVLSMSDGRSELTAIIDEDSRPRRIEMDLQELVDSLSREYGSDIAAQLIIARPDLDTILGFVPAGASWKERERLRRLPTAELARRLERDLTERVRSDPTAATILRAVGINTSTIGSA